MSREHIRLIEFQRATLGRHNSGHSRSRNKPVSNQQYVDCKTVGQASERVEWRGMPTEFRRTLFIVAALNLAYFGIEFAAAVVIGSVSLFADSIDFLEDAALNALILLAMRWTAPHRSAVAKVPAGHSS